MLGLKSSFAHKASAELLGGLQGFGRAPEGLGKALGHHGEHRGSATEAETPGGRAPGGGAGGVAACRVARAQGALAADEREALWHAISHAKRPFFSRFWSAF